MNEPQLQSLWEKRLAGWEGRRSPEDLNLGTNGLERGVGALWKADPKGMWE